MSRLEQENAHPTLVSVGRYLLAIDAMIEDFFIALMDPDEVDRITGANEPLTETAKRLALMAEPADEAYERLVRDLTELLLTELRQISVRRWRRGKAR